MNKKTNKNQIPEKAIQLLPWYALDLLTLEENNYIELALLEFPELQDQLKAEFETIDFLKEKQDIFHLSAIESSEKRLEHLFNKEVFNTKKPSFKHQISSFMRSLVSGDLAGTQYLGFAVISTLSIALLFAFVAPLLEEKNTFYPAYTGSTEEKNQQKVTALLVGLNVSPDNPQLIKLLNSLKAKAIAIPGKDGMYRMTFNKKPSTSELNKAVQKLSSNKELVWFVGEAY